MKTNKLLLLALALVFVIAFAACDVDPIVNSNAINGLADISLTCGDSLPEITPTSEYGEITLGIAKAVEGTSKEELTYAPLTTDALTVGTYYVKASVAAASTYEAAAAYATITVSHQAFDSIAGEGTAHSETTADGKYHTWTEKQCVCGATVIGNEQTADKQPNAISGLADVTLNCGVSPDLSGITATHGDVVLEIATAVEGTDKEQLTYAALPDDLTVVHGVYYVRATVAEGENYQGATLYAKVTVEHLAFADIDGEATHVAAEGTTKGYDYKTCACSAQIKGDEYVIVTIKLDGTTVATEEVVVGGTIDDGAIDEANLPTRNGYELVLVDANGNEWESSDVEDFATIELSSYWIIIDSIDLGNVTGNWRFIANDETGYTEKTVSTLIHDEENSLWVVNTYFDENKPTSPAELTLGDIELKAGHTYVITLATDRNTYVNFGTATWDDYAYLIDNELGLCIITVTYTGEETIVTFNGEHIVQYTNEQWSNHNLKGLTLAIQDKKLEDAGERYTVYIADVITVVYDYCAHEAQLVNTLPEAANVDEDSAEAVMATINQIEAIRNAHFTEAELADAKDIDDVKEAAQAILNNHILNLNKLFKAIPDFDTMLDADHTQADEDVAYTAFTKYLAYYNVMLTEDEKAEYGAEPKKISFYREFFKDRTAVMDNAFSQSSAPFNPWNNYPNSHWNPNNQSGMVTLPKIAYGAFDKVQFYVQAAGGNIVMKYNDHAVTSGSWHEFVITKQDDGWYASFDWTDQSMDARVSFKLSNDIVLGNEAIQFYFENDAWGWLCIGIHDNPNQLNHINGTLTAGEVTVHTVTSKWTTGSGDFTHVGYYLNDDYISLAKDAPLAWSDDYGKHTFIGWFTADGTEYKAGMQVTGSLELTAKYEIKDEDWCDYKVDYFVDDDQYGETQHYRFMAELVLPTAPTKDEDETYIYTFIGWFNEAGKEYKAGSAVDGKLELFAKFSEFDKTREKYNVTLKNLEGDDHVEVYDGEAAVLPTVARSGYIFDCWLLDGEKYNTAAEVTSNIELVAKWLVRANGEKATVISAGDLSANVTGSLNDGRTGAVDKADSWWTDNDGTKLDQWFLVGNNKTKELLTFELPVIDFSNYSQLSFNLLINAGFTGSISIVPDGSENATDLAANSQGGCVKMVLAKVNGVWTIAAHCENGNVQSAAIPANVVAGEAKLQLRYWTNADWTTNAEGELVDGPWVFMSEVKGIAFGNVDYIQKAASAAAAIDALADDADDATKLAALKTYMYWRLCFTAYEQENNAETASVVALKTYLNGLGAQTIVENCYNEIETTMPDWDGNANKYNPNGKTYSVSLPKIMYGMYDSITMVMKCNSEAATFTASYGNESLDVTMNNAAGGLMFTVSKHDDGCYYMRVWDENGSASFEVKLSDEIVRGDESFTFDFATTAWSWCCLGTQIADNCITATVAK